MIDVSNLKDALKTLGFVAYGDIYEKVFFEIGCSLKVDFQAKRLIYPNEIKGRERNDGFDQKENFVVFECVCRLLSKGYRPEHIELEKEWHLGHDAKGGRADICVSDTSGNMLFIIECKTWGREYDKALNNTKSDGAQLFSYWQQEQSCKWLVLYASDLRSGCIAYKAPTIDCSDDANIILLSKKDKSIKLYRDAHTTSAKYEAWKETYGSQIHDDLIFSEDSVAYQIGVKPLRKKDLRDFTPDDKIVNKFEEILRHNNVSDKENAFNRLVALFICKLVDESTKNEDDEVEFQYKQGTDTYETLQDRLQRLHRDGMEKFMREEILYVSADYPEWLFSTYTGSKRKRAIEDLQNTIRILKFYSNNDFAFKDVHNEELFYQNGKILVEMVQLFEKYRIVYPSKHQFLGDLFEQLLNKGFKQNEGQFFTPMPITRFIWDSLPVDRMVGKRLFAGQNGLPLQVSIHHCDHRFIVGQLTDDDGHRLDSQHLTRRQPTMAGDQLVAAVGQRPCKCRSDSPHLADALDHPLHLLVVLHLEGMTLERVQLGQRNIPHPLQLGIVPLRLRGKQVIQRG